MKYFFWIYFGLLGFIISSLVYMMYLDVTVYTPRYVEECTKSGGVVIYPARDAPECWDKESGRRLFIEMDD